jgi:lipid-A-disaccharide synthase
VDVTYVGHPLIDIVRTEIDREAFSAKIGMVAGERLVALLPGSRRQEIKQHMRPLMETAAILRRSVAGVRFVMVTLPSSEGIVREEMGEAGGGIDVATALRYEAIAYSDLAITCSGTVTLEAALLGTPMIVIYKLAAFSWALGRLIVRVPYISLVNLVAREMVVPEFIQAEVRPERLAGEAARLLNDDERRLAVVERLGRVRSKLGPGGATRRAAEVALSLTSK